MSRTLSSVSFVVTTPPPDRRVLPTGQDTDAVPLRDVLVRLTSADCTMLVVAMAPAGP